MFLGHFALAVATKPVVPTVPVGVLMAASQALDLAFIPLVAVGVESINMAGYGQSEINAFYSHSVVGTLVIAGVVFAIGKAVWKSSRVAWTLALLSASHWPLDLVVHRQDMPLLPGNFGDFPLLGLGLWNTPWVALAIEVVMAVIALVIYFRWASQQPEANSRRYWGPVITAILFVVIVLTDLPSTPAT